MQIGSPTFPLARRFALVALALITFVLAMAGSAKAAPQTYVIGGESVTPTQYANDYSFMVGLLPDSDPNHQFCGGTLIAPQWVVTAAHCWAPEEGVVPRNVFIGSENLFSGGQIVPVVGRFAHPAWDSDLIENDIMLLKLAYAPAGTPALRATPAQDPSGGDLATILGWGLTSAGSGASAAAILQRADIDVINQGTCQSDWFAFQVPIASSQLCAIHYGSSGPDVPRIACSGDSGGPLLAGGRLVGIVSFGYVGCFPEAPTVYTRVSFYNGWIDGVRSKALSVTSGDPDFGAVDKDSGTVDRTFYFRSDGDDPIAINGAAGSGDFYVKSSTCAGILAPGASCSVTVTFDPSAGGMRMGTLALSTDSTGYPTFPVALTGVGAGKLNLPVKLKITQIYESRRAKGGARKAYFHVSFWAPKGIDTKSMCVGNLGVSLMMRTSKPVFKKTKLKYVGSGCSVEFSGRVARSVLHKKSKAIIKFAGNDMVAPSGAIRTIRIR